MNLDFLNDLANHIEKNEGVKSFLNELQNFLSNIKIDNNGINGVEPNLLDAIKSTRNVSLISENQISNKKDKILENYSREELEKGPIYFIADRIGNDYRIEKYDNGTRENMRLAKNDLPEEAKVNTIIRENEGKYIVDQEASSYILEQIEENANQILDEQDAKLQAYRQEGHLYTITEDMNGRIFLWDLTEKPETEIEEVDFPNELRASVSEGTTLLYENGRYTIKEDF